MGRLINTGMGEVSDRLSILALKILNGSEQGKDVSPFEIERAALLSQIRSRTLNAKWFELVLELAAVNATIWHAEDDLRALRSDLTALAETAANEQGRARVEGTVTALAFRTQRLNDRRAELVGLINRDAGDSSPSEKLT